MCGIALIVSYTAEGFSENKLFESIRRRGPDSFKVVRLGCICFAASVLHLRGVTTTDITAQPLIDDLGNILLYNGEVYNTDESSDTECLSKQFSLATSLNDIVEVLNSLKGPWSVIYYFKRFNCIVYARDRIGRRSLLQLQSATRFILSSVAFDECDNASIWERVSVSGVHILRVQNGLQPTKVETIAWPSDVAYNYSLEIKGSFQECITILKAKICDTVEEELLSSAQLLVEALNRAVKIRVTSLPYKQDLEGNGEARIAILYSGGIDCSILAALAHQHVNKYEPIDLINVCFDAERNHTSPDRLQAIEAFSELTAAYPKREWRLVLVNSSYHEVLKHANRIIQLCYPNQTHMDFNIGAALWFASRGDGFLYDISQIQDSVTETYPTTLQQLFTTSTAKADDFKMQSNDRERRKCQSNLDCRRLAKPKCRYSSCKLCCKKLQRQHNNSCDVHKTTLCVMEESDAGNHSENAKHLVKNKPRQRYVSKAKILLNGLGADEQLGGYGRHRQAFLYRGWNGLEQELELDVARLWSRNLGRDDRCCSDHGKELRHPYLDEDVMFCLTSKVPIEHKVNYNLPRALGDKRLLRIICHILSLPRTASYEKRAIQFGTRLAKLSNVNCFGSNRAFDGEAIFTLPSGKSP